MSELQMKLPKKSKKLSNSKLSGRMWVMDSTPNMGVKVKHISLNIGPESRIVDASSNSYWGFTVTPSPRLHRVQVEIISSKSNNVKQALRNRVTKMVEEEITMDSEESSL